MGNGERERELMYNTEDAHHELSSNKRLTCLNLETLQKTEIGLLQKGN
jgi:hypothetical protein